MQTRRPAPMFTLLLPTRGQGESPFLREAVSSVLEQTDADWNMLIINGGQQPLQFPQDPRIHFLELWPEKGVAVAINRALSQVATPFVAILHDDDRLAPHCVATLKTAISQHPEADYFHSARRYIGDQGEFLSEVYPAPAEVKLQDFQGTCPVKHLHAYRVTSALAVGGLDESLQLHGCDDFEFPWRMAEAGFQFQAIADCLYYQRDHRSAPRLTTDVPLDAQVDTLRRIFRKHGLPPETIEREIATRKAGYLRQALFEDELDQRSKLEGGFDRQSGWREPLEAPRRKPWWRRFL